MRDYRNRVIRVTAAFLVSTASIASIASAQQPPDSGTNRQWRVTFVAGFATGGTPTGGRGFLPPPGEAFIPVPGAPASRRVATWWLGDGAALVNEVFRVSTPPGPPGTEPGPSLRAVDALVTSGTVARRPGLALGARATRGLSDRFDLEIGLDVGMQPLKLTRAALNELHSIRGSFTATFDTLLDRARRENFDVTASLTTPAGTPRQSTITGALLYTFRPGDAVQPYVLGGGGLLLSSGSVEYTLVGRYTFTNGPLVTGETDTLRVVTEWSNSAVAIVGAGVRKALSARHGVSAEARWALSAPRPRTQIDATPGRDPASSAGFGAAVFLTTPSLAIIGVNDMGFDSSLSAPALDDFTTFDGTGRLLSLTVSFGYFLSF